MTSNVSTKPIRDGVGNSFQQRVLDISGAGAGPFLPVIVIAAPADGAPIDLATLFAGISADLDTVADRVESALAVLPAPDAPFTPLGHQSITVTSTAQTLGALLSATGGPISAIPAGTKLLYLQPRGDGIRYAHGGAAPGTGATDPGTDIFEGGQYPLRLDEFASLMLAATGNTVLSIEFRG